MHEWQHSILHYIRSQFTGKHTLEAIVYTLHTPTYYVYSSHSHEMIWLTRAGFIDVRGCRTTQRCHCILYTRAGTSWVGESPATGLWTQNTALSTQEHVTQTIYAQTHTQRERDKQTHTHTLIHRYSRCMYTTMYLPGVSMVLLYK